LTEISKWKKFIPAPLCVAPWKAISVDSNGIVRPDQIYKGEMGNLKTQNIDQIWNSNEWKSLRHSHKFFHNDERCSKCWNKENLTGHSRRKFFESFFSERVNSEQLEEIVYPDKKGNLDLTNAVNRPRITDFDLPDFIYLDINSSNKCNLKCIHCSSFASTAWIPDERKMHKYLKENLDSFSIGPIEKYQAIDETIIDNLFSNEKYFENLQFVAFRGGEPFYEKKNLYILKKLIKLGWNDRINLDISTNGTILDSEFLDLISQFKKVILYISLEGVGDLYSYCRGGRNYNQVNLEKSIDYFSNVTNVELCLAYTTMVLNIFNIKNTWDWFQQYKDHATITFSNTVFEPKHLSLYTLSKEQKQEAYDMIKDINDDLPWPFDKKKFLYSAGIWKLQEKLSIDEESDDRNRLWNNFKNYINFLDKIRDTNLLEVEPTFRKYWNE
jgi:radical SAM protein with 4Fe4S-binding SPASM domain